MDKTYYVYIMASMKNGTIYIGMTNALSRRVYEHKQNLNPNSFTSKHNIHRLVYYEAFGSPSVAIAREKFLKKKVRSYKIKLIEKNIRIGLNCIITCNSACVEPS